MITWLLVMVYIKYQEAYARLNKERGDGIKGIFSSLTPFPELRNGG
jgi:hypothetical protein